MQRPLLNEVVIHHAGVAVVMAFLMVRKGLTLDAAYRHVSSRRPSSCLNPGFIRQLALLEGLVSRGAREESDRAFAEYRWVSS